MSLQKKYIYILKFLQSTSTQSKGAFHSRRERYKGGGRGGEIEGGRDGERWREGERERWRDTKRGGMGERGGGGGRQREDNSTYHLTIYWVGTHIYFSQSPSCHIPSTNVGLTKKKTRASLGFTTYPDITGQGIYRPEMLIYSTRLYYNPTIINQGIFRPKQ